MKKNATNGFTLVELMVTVSVAAILLVIAVPSFSVFLMNNRMATQANDLISALNLARSEAVRRGATVTVCASSNQATCIGGWAQGWVVRDPAGAVIRVQQALSGGSTLVGGANVATTVAYTTMGNTTIPVGSAIAQTTLTLCPPAPAAVQGRAIQIESTGRVASAPVACP
ncbi:MAG: hypothetical protein COS39_04810 [Hydrogenophilales bacterium CG03_land_8_20_14_0_80_62_28]|nr:prepilin-type N-terminal cleavage/methylation domain-containing protein [Betaproteobacteria bacterium]OIO79279.1 MAG: hypothetical protein AUJ86_02415 [Hydrogenophilaceae bacterium CG1_02_62_390]PIV23315.1 MAG: hypothetical protein COS39_04810 [Hydrogenophilales bacterium CG03_land_8_20_14_0_80_62_28]PIW70800.1 MAG: hypothetical protein COW07_11455 [Hydrogenophilales bacterium CG12_big_fil_rev_8_21_14_0_65_61_21]PIX00486.1 MAG: hypothetical protein COZ79_11945 [Hydrogenophilales bacterium CG